MMAPIETLISLNFLHSEEEDIQVSISSPFKVAL